MKNILIVSLNSGGTMGHGRIITSLANGLVKYKKNVTVVSETDYSHFFNLDKGVKNIILPETKHVNYTLGGMHSYKQKDKILEICEKKKANCIFFSTFFDLELVNEIKTKGIKVILLSYPIRDTFRKALIVNKVYNVFDKIISLYDPSVNEKKLENEIIVNPLNIVRNILSKESEMDIVLTYGGGGRPSSRIFLNKTYGALKPILKEKKLKVTLIKGNSKNKENNKEIKSIEWSKKFEGIIAFSKIVISEAGYFTMLDLINYNKFAIFIPGKRIIDNQELRAVILEKCGIGKIFFPFEKKQKLTKLIKESLNNPSKDHTSTFDKVKRKFAKYKDLMSVVLKELQ